VLLLLESPRSRILLPVPNHIASAYSVTATANMDQVHGVDVSWLHTPNKGKRTASSTPIPT
jgi:hypothetical protein